MQFQSLNGAVDLRIGTAGWSIPRASMARFSDRGTHLERYARSLRCAEINSSFYRPHSAATYTKWRGSVPSDFQFAVKVPRTITHELKLRHALEPFAVFLAQTDGLSEKRGPLLVQLPPSLAFDAAVVTSFLQTVRERYEGPMACEPRHATWFSPSAVSLLEHYRIARVAADPPRAPGALAPAGWMRLAYFRLHGSPRIYWSRYDRAFLISLRTTIRSLSSAERVWCVFDNTASGAAVENASELSHYLSAESTDQASLFS